MGKKWFAPHYPFVVVDNPLLSGIACLAAINRFQGQKIDLQPLIQRQLSHSRADNLISVSHKADSLGYITRLLYLNNEGLDKPTLPAIVENDLGELCLLLEVSPTQVILANPLTKIHVIDRKEFISTWNGKLLTVNLVSNFANIGTQTLKIFQQFIPLARPYWSILVWIAIITLIFQLLGAVGPLFSQIIIDQVVVNGDYSLLFLMLLGMLFVTGFQLASSALREFLVVRALKQISVSLLLRFLDHILSLPKAIFSKWQVGDFTVRFQENEKLMRNFCS